MPSSNEALLSDLSVRAGEATLGNPRESAKLISFYAGFPDPGSLPIADIIDSTRVAIESEGEWALQYGAPAGDERLIEELLRKLARDQKIDAGPENILVTNGASQALSLIVDMLVEPGDPVVSEAPTWMGAVANFNQAAAEIHEVGVDESGTRTDELRSTLARLRDDGKRAKFLYVIPNFQNPMGVSMTLERRKELLAIAEEFDVPVVEDDAYFDLRYSGETLPTLYSLDTSGRVMYMGTFSKIMAAGMRLGWVVAHEDVINRLIALKPDGGTSPFGGFVATEFAASGTLIEHVQELRTLYRQRRDAMLASLERSMPAGTFWTNPDGGFFIWVRFPKGVNMETLAPACRERGVEISPGPIFYFDGRGANEMRLSYSFATEDQISEGIAILAEEAKKQLESAATS
ncbi:PLP-dependent aminotransferase family protein [soil metagenome]